MAKQFSDEEVKAWLAEQPAKPLSSKVLLQNDVGHVLVLKPNYKPGWSLPGGMVNEGESPLRAALRETKEEAGIELEPAKLCFLGVRYGVSRRSGKDFVHFLFGVQLSTTEIATMKIDTSEIEDSRWIEPQNLNEFVEENVGPMAARLLAAGSSAATYSEEDQFFVDSPHGSS